MALAQAQLRRSLRAAARGRAATLAQVADGARAFREFMGNAPKAVKRQSPHEVIVAQTYDDDLAGTTRVGVSSFSFEEAIGAVNADDNSLYQRTAAMSWSGLLRPISTSTSATTLPHYTSPALTGCLDRTELDPWRAANDVEVWANGSTYGGLHATRWGGDRANARIIGLRGPLLMAGWGYDWEGNPVPGEGGEFSSNYLTHSENWKAGPVDLLWDERRGVWTCHDAVRGVSQGAFAASGSGPVVVHGKDGATGWAVEGYGWTAPVSSGDHVQLLWNVLDKKWYALPGGGADVAPSSLYSFHSPEFLVTTGEIPYEVRAHWAASGIEPIDYVSRDGSGELFARHDHVHQHPVFESGNLHPEYLRKPSGVCPPSGHYLTTYGDCETAWAPPANALVEKGPMVSGTCFYDGYRMDFQHEQGSGCCWASGDAVYLTEPLQTYSGVYLPSFYSGRYHAGRPVYAAFAEGAPASGIVVCQPAPSGGGGGGVVEDFCGCDAVPLTLYLTFSDGTGDCVCLDGASAELTFNEGTQQWEGSLTACETEHPVLFYCPFAPGLFTLDINALYTRTAANDSCDPFLFTASSEDMQDYCTGTATVTVSE